MKWVEHEATQEKVQNECNTQKRCNINRVQHEKSATWKDCHMKKCSTDKVKHEMSATQKKCEMKRVQHETTREKVQHEKSSIVKYVKKVHKNSTWQMDNGPSVDGPLYTASLMLKVFIWAGLINFNNALRNRLYEMELQMSRSNLFHSLGTKEFLKYSDLQETILNGLTCH